MKSQIQFSTTTRTERKNHVKHITFTGNENHLIALEKAIRLTEDYRRSVPDESILGGTLSRQIFDRLLHQQTCVGIRIYNASNDDNSPTFVLVGVNSNNSDLFSGIVATQPTMSSTSLVHELTDSNPAHTDSGDTASDIGLTCSNRSIHLTTLAEASRLARNFRSSAQGIITKGGFFGKNIFNRILSQPGCVGIQIYFAMRDDGNHTLVLAGVDRMGRHFAKWPFGDDLYPCPPFCAPSNPLNR